MIKYKILQLFSMLKIIRSLFLNNGKLILKNKSILDLWIKEVKNIDKIGLLNVA